MKIAKVADAQGNATYRDQEGKVNIPSGMDTEGKVQNFLGSIGYNDVEFLPGLITERQFQQEQKIAKDNAAKEAEAKAAPVKPAPIMSEAISAPKPAVGATPNVTKATPPTD